VAKMLKIRQIRSAIERKEDQKRTIRALGLRRMHHQVIQPDNPAIRGMVFKVKHLVTVEEFEG
jgi:large subunit ribosomal protein L30